MKGRHSIAFFLIISIISMGLLSTYAWLTWGSPENTELTVTVGDILEVVFKTGNDINATDMTPILNPTVDGEITEFYIVNNSQSKLYTSFTMNITELPDELKIDSFSYKILSSSDNNVFTEVATGSFKDVVVGENVLYDKVSLVSGATYYKFIIYLDGYKETPSTAVGKNFSGILNVELTSSAPISDYVMALSNEVVGWEANVSGVFKTIEGDYRYVGANVENYVSFNNDLYRIIGVFDEKSHGQEGKYLTKLISANILSSNAWGVHNKVSDMATYNGVTNDWTGNTKGVKASANVLLNAFFYNKSSTDSTYGSCVNWTYISALKTYNCSDIVGYGIDSTLHEYISDARWYLYGYTSTEFSKQDYYQCERGLSEDTTNCLLAGPTDAPYSEYEDAKIGLMYASDYLYAGSKFGSEDTTVGLSNSGSQNWLSKGYEWTITPIGGTTNKAVTLQSNGALNPFEVSVGIVIRPTFYLNSTVYINGGNGTFEDPYVIVLNQA